MNWKPQDMRPGLARRVFDQLAADSSRRPVLPTVKTNAIKQRGKRSNDGRDFQDAIIRTALAYKASRVMKLEKCDPPTKIAGGKIIFMENPFPDFVGVHHDGRMIALEAKSTSTPRLPFDRHGGITEKQVTLLVEWGERGAISGVLWEYRGETTSQVVWITWQELVAGRSVGLKSFHFNKWQVLKRGTGVIDWDFAACFGDRK